MQMDLPTLPERSISMPLPGEQLPRSVPALWGGWGATAGPAWGPVEDFPLESIVIVTDEVHTSHAQSIV